MGYPFGRWSDRRRASLPNGEGDAPLSEKSRSLNEVEVRVWREADSAMIHWIHPQDADPSDIPDDALWFVERSSSPYGPFYSIGASLPRTQRTYRDDDVNVGRANTRYIFYRVRWSSALESSEGVYGQAPQWEDGVAGGVTWEHGGVPSHLVPAVAREIRRRSVTILSTRQGEPCLLYRPAWLSPKDSNQVNPHTGTYMGDMRASIDDLQSPFSGGYDHPTLTYVNKAASALSIQVSSGRINDMSEGISGELPYWPPIQIDDILRFMDGDLLMVSAINPLMIHGHVNAYSVALTQLERTHSINTLRMPSNFRDLSLYPRRQGARATSMEGYRRSLARGAMNRTSLGQRDVAPESGEEDR